MVVERFEKKSHRQWANLVIDYSEEPDLEAIYNMPIRDLAEHFNQITNDEAGDVELDDEDDKGDAMVIKEWLEKAAKVKETYKQLCKDKKKKDPKLPHTKLINKEKKPKDHSTAV